MSGSTDHRASKTPRASRRERILNLTTARNMLPLVQRIIADYIHGKRGIGKLRPELNRLDRGRRELSWPERQRRYALQEEIAAWEKQNLDLSNELHELGLAIVDDDGRVGFPTLVNNRPAYFAWWPQEDDIRYWHFADEVTNRAIPTAWLQAEGITLAGQK